MAALWIIVKRGLKPYLGISVADILGGEADHAPSHVEGALTGLEHARQPVECRIRAPNMHIDRDAAGGVVEPFRYPYVPFRST